VKLWRWLHPSDLLVVGYAGLLAALLGLFRHRIEAWQTYLGVTGGVAALSLLLTVGAGFPRARWLRAVHAFDAFVFIPALFFVTVGIVHRVNPRDYDWVLMRVDALIGGDRLLGAMKRWESPALNDLMMILWVSYYALPVIPGIEMYLRRRERFFEVKTMVLLGFLLAYVGYFAAPALGAGYFLEPMNVAPPGPGVVAMAPLQQVIWRLEDAEARHAYPSGHTAGAVVTIGFALRYRLRTALLAVPQGLGVIASTLYLRYHYLTDVLVGVFFGAAAIFLGWWLHRVTAGRASGRCERVSESRRNVWRSALVRLGLGLPGAVAAAWGLVQAARVLGGGELPAGWDRAALAALPVTLGAAMVLLWSGAGDLLMGRPFALLDPDGVRVGRRRVRWTRIERLERVEEAGVQRLDVIYRAGYVVPGEARAVTLARTRGDPTHFNVVARLSRGYLLKYGEPSSSPRAALTPPLA
jgi:membrane-associated phospholipid phosphatase